VEYAPADRLVFLGDLIDRGSHGPEVVRLVRQLAAECVLGNHDEKHVRWRKHEARVLTEPGYKNPMRFKAGQIAENAQLTDSDIAWLATLPCYINLGALDGGVDWYAVHGGFEPTKPLSAQRCDKLVRMRYVNAHGGYVALPKTLQQPPGTFFWTELWTAPQNVVYGHTVHSLTDPRIDNVLPQYGTCFGIDTGCCFGGRLTAFILPEGEFVQVQAKREYAPLRRVNDES
jgi:hypothetical protein